MLSCPVGTKLTSGCGIMLEFIKQCQQQKQALQAAALQVSKAVPASTHVDNVDVQNALLA